MYEAIAAALSDGSMDQFVADANELALGNVYEACWTTTRLKSREVNPSPIRKFLPEREEFACCVPEGEINMNLTARRIRNGMENAELFWLGVVLPCPLYACPLYSDHLALFLLFAVLAGFRCSSSCKYLCGVIQGDAMLVQLFIVYLCFLRIKC